MKGRLYKMKQKHLTLKEREFIEEKLKENWNFTSIGKELNKHRTTISKEILNHRFQKETVHYNSSFANCIHTYTCENAESKFCKKSCSKFKEKTPYVCNGCPKKSHCRFSKYYYRAKDANKEYNKFKSDARIGRRLSQEEIYKINNIITPLIRNQHQSINHVFINNPDLLYFSKPTFYSYVNLNLFSFRNIDLARRVKYKPRKEDKKRRTRKESIIRIRRTHNDFNDYMAVHPNASIVEMDTVEGIKGGKVFLTLLFRNYNFMLIFLMESKSMEEVEKIFIKIRNLIGIDTFKRIFEVILTDNGSEFFNPISIEVDYNTGEVLSHVFYCNPYCSYQKGSIEKNHEYIRNILPKKTSFNNLTQKDCDLIASHINSTSRIILNIKFINPNQVNLSPNLLKKVYDKNDRK